ncbi:MAG: hypothetical protein K5905_08050 [Roseibium sp.]|uniref:hypothetical protein n=1 Tax=Roseibium sp. TaxID=1936156 RepID=UPI00261D1204|nr:hypothetical protein [Roseibium sp.]MCV0425411.1 hypothetical protein [Roseibium sp.]
MDATSFDYAGYQPKGDKKNSEFFETYRHKIYERRQSSGIDDNVGHMKAMIVQVEAGDGVATMAEIHRMTPNRYHSSYISQTHKLHVLHTKPEFPALIIKEPLSSNYEDYIKRLNVLYPLARQKPNTRYVGEIFDCSDINTVRKTLEDQSIRFEYPGDTENALYTSENILFSTISDFTGNRVGYSAGDFNDPASLSLGEPYHLTDEEKAQLAKGVAFAETHGLNELMLGYDHMATRILAGEREDAILEFLTMVPYYFWGAYNIQDMNSSTNVNRCPTVSDDKQSPAKVFTANNTPSFVNSFENLPMPTENFVRNYGRRMHHMAVEVEDGDHETGQKNVDYVVGILGQEGVPFLAHVVGECKDSPDLKQIFSKHSQHTLLITEYIERCKAFDGFFTKSNVAALTEAAGKDERYQHGHVFD